MKSQKFLTVSLAAYKKNDQAWIEQKNGAVIRRMVGYGRLEGTQTALTVVAPEQEGEYLLQAAVVQDGVTWFDTIEPKSSAELFVRVESAAPPSAGR